MSFPRANAAVDYPLFAVDFDPEDATRIMVGGGGGPGRSGVANKIVSTFYTRLSITVHYV